MSLGSFRYPVYQPAMFTESLETTASTAKKGQVNKDGPRNEKVKLMRMLCNKNVI